MLPCLPCWASSHWFPVHFKLNIDLEGAVILQNVDISQPLSFVEELEQCLRFCRWKKKDDGCVPKSQIHWIWSSSGLIHSVSFSSIKNRSFNH